MNPFDLSRRGFLTSSVASATLIGMTDPVPAQPPSPPSAADGANLADILAPVPFHFDRAAFFAIVERPFPHRQLGVGKSFAGATTLMAGFRNSLAAYADPDGFAAGPASLHCAAVLYAGYSYNMVLDDAMYAKYPLGLMDDEEMRPNDLRYRAFWKALRRNPMENFLRPLIDQGTSFFVCNNALSRFAAALAHRTAPNGVAPTRKEVVAIHDELVDHFIPETRLVPSGVAAVNAVQEAHFTFGPDY
ncbi:MAG: hypothetical protein ACREM2_00520 [Vulcanimicrobiaceae bacterium]